MKSVIIEPKNEVLKKYIQYFLFFKKTDNNILNYTTFPNNNLCLAIYKENAINYINHSKNNNCIITKGNKDFTSRFYGFHSEPFNVNINSSLDQICIIFHPSAIRAFICESYDDLMDSDNVLEYFYDISVNDLVQVFENNNFSNKADKLEQLFLTNLKYEVPDKIKEALYNIPEHNSDHFTVDTLAKNLSISTSTLFRLFKNYVGHNPKSYLKTLRFRSALNEILKEQSTLTRIGHFHNYHDQAHFINDFKSLSGHSPRELREIASVQQNNFTWIYNKK
ncbi:AraC family transcriptional regulator [Salegentibacter sp. Hel_I_6]|uniref:helix-turn-helix domain-containing protein n=1 Tax=Salegentibacter sp. Hel_I_6 TaxID=1250278 RepID=UPI00068CE734|nr:AraC family transcriptional regulator [Salegentibacter sp. Hel_I_6]